MGKRMKFKEELAVRTKQAEEVIRSFLPFEEGFQKTLFEAMNYTYILKCKDETLYTGWTNDIEKRLEAHNAGKGAKYTRSRRPVELVYLEQFETKEEAMRREYAIKHMTRRAKLGLVMSYKETGQ